MIELGEEYVIKSGSKKYFCFVHNRNEIGKQFYLRKGFRHIADNDHEDEWFMEKVLY